MKILFQIWFWRFLLWFCSMPIQFCIILSRVNYFQSTLCVYAVLAVTTLCRVSCWMGAWKLNDDLLLCVNLVVVYWMLACHDLADIFSHGLYLGHFREKVHYFRWQRGYNSCQVLRLPPWLHMPVMQRLSNMLRSCWRLRNDCRLVVRLFALGRICGSTFRWFHSSISILARKH